jgi:outer membrane protein assembly factor BamE (lipoprotein component of BamABCDE complex)
MKKKLIPALFCMGLFFFSCSLTPNIKLSGVADLDKKQEVLAIGTTNKNDTINYLGETILKEYSAENNWAYIETEELKTIFGRNKVIKNNVLLLQFDSKGILSKKNMLTINDLKKLNLDQTTTTSQSINSSISKKLFSSMRKRFDNSRSK